MKANDVLLLLVFLSWSISVSDAQVAPERLLPSGRAPHEDRYTLASAADPPSLVRASAGLLSEDAELLASVSLLEARFTALYDDMAAVEPDPLAGGMILMWSGAADRVPSGWALCDGANGTPDLRGRFVRGAGGAGEVGERGGALDHGHTAAGHQHPFPTPAHSHSVAALDGIWSGSSGRHAHGMSGPTGGSVHVYQFGFGGQPVSSVTHTHMVFESGRHVHSLAIPAQSTGRGAGTNQTDSADSTVDNTEHVPPYHALAYIMKLPEKDVVSTTQPSGLDIPSRVTALTQKAAELASSVKGASSNAVPPGLIALSSGLTESLPSAWIACEGTGGAPDLRDRFVMGALGSSEAGEMGGAVSHSHRTHAHSHQVVMPFHSHALPEVLAATAVAGEHTHTLEATSSIWFTDPSSEFYDRAILASHRHTLDLAGAHSHTLTLPATATEREEGSGWTGLMDSGLESRSHLPPFYRIRFLMKRGLTAGALVPTLAPAGSAVATRVEALEKAATDASASVNRAAINSIPDGTIAIWSGTQESVPAGWIRCDGRYGTPDLRGRFVSGAQAEGSIRGGSSTHNHTIGTHQHDTSFAHHHEYRSRTLRTLTAYDRAHWSDLPTSHTHSMSALTDSVESQDNGDSIHTSDWVHAHDLLDGGEEHEHDVVVNQPISAATDSLTGSSTAEAYAGYEAENLPPYHKLIFIMKTGAASTIPRDIMSSTSVAIGEGLAVTVAMSSINSTLAKGTRIGRAYLSKDAEYSPYVDRYLGEITFDPAHLAGGTYNVNESLEIPSVPPGEYFIVMQLDRERMTAGTTATNIFRSQAIQVRVPDLTPTTLSAPDSVAAGESLAATWMVRNVGDAEAKPTWQDRLYLSADSTYSSMSDRYLGLVDHESALAPDGTYQADLKFTMPNVPPGQYYLIVQLDHYGRVYEGSEANQFRSYPIQIRVPDLVPVALEAPATVDAGQALTATWEVANHGNTAALPAWRDRLYLSTDAKYSSIDDRYLGDVTHEAALGVEENYTANLRFTMLNVQPGSYYLILQIDHYDHVFESSKTNQYRSLPIRVRVPDLTPMALTAPAVVDAGQTLTAAWTALNRGDAAARPSWRDRLVLSTDETYGSSNDRFLGDVMHETLLAAGNSYAADLPFTMPAVSPGFYSLILRLDHYDSVFESNKTNQYRSLPIRVRVPDLVPTKLVAPSESVAGQSLTAGWTVENVGDAEARGSWEDRLYLSTNAVYSSLAARYLGNVVHEGGLAAGASYTASLKFTMPNVPPGPYYVIVKSDHYDRVFESDEKNNTRSQGLGPEPTKPILTSLTTSGTVSKTAQIRLSSPPTAKRIEVSVNGDLMGTVYGTASHASPTITLGPGVMSSGSHRIVADAYDEMNNRVSSASSVIEEWKQSFITELRLEEPGRSHIIYADDLAAGDDTVLIRAYAAWLHVWSRPIPGGHGSYSGQDWVPLTNGQFRVKFYIDSVLVHTSTNGLATDPYIHEYNYRATGWGMGAHTVRVALVPPEGYRPATESATVTVEARHPELTISRDVVAAGNHFEVTLTLRNRGSAAASMQWFKEPMTGFQACCAGGSLVPTETRWSFDPVSRVGIYRFELGGESIPADSSATLTYKAVPILFRSDCRPVFGGDDGEYAFAGTGGSDTVETWRTTTSRTSPWERRLALSDAVTQASAGADYLLITDPVNLTGAFGNSGMRNVLTNMAELATMKNGVLGYYHTFGSAYSPYRAGDAVATGCIFREGDGKDQLFIGSMHDDRVYCYADLGEITLGDHQLPVEIAWAEWDALALGNVINSSALSSDTHTREEIIIGLPPGHGGETNGGVFVYQYEYLTEDHFNRYQLATGALEPVPFNSGDRIAVGNALDDPAYQDGDEIFVARGDGTVDIYAGGGWSVASFESKYRSSDFFAAGDLLGPNDITEIVVGDVAWNIKIYVNTSATSADTPHYEELYRIPVNPALQDGLAVGDVVGDAYKEIVYADQSRGRIQVYGYDAAADAFIELARFSIDYHEDDRLACGRFTTADKEQILVLRGSGTEGRREGTVDVISHLEGEAPGDRWALDRLINVGGRWANALTNTWTTEGHLLIVGENEIIPTFTKNWTIDDWETSGRVDYTDRDFASTGADDDSNTPELAVGRIVGNSAERISKALRTAMELAREPWRLSNSHALCLSGPNPGDNDKFIDNRESIAGKLSGHGFEVSERHLPTDHYFFANDAGQDVIFLAGHGNTALWDDCLTSSNVFHHFDPGTSRPLVYAASCRTGRYPASGGTMSEQFLWNQAIGYIGATENTYSWGSHGRGWCPRLAEAFFDRIQADRTIGQSLKLAKRNRLSDAASTYRSDWNKNRYHAAVYHLYGDPKAQFSWAAARLALASVGHAPSSSEPVRGPLSQYQLQVPSYRVSVGATSDEVEIPGGDWTGVTGKPSVPFYTAIIRFPKGQVVQAVNLKQRSAPHITTGLRLAAVVPVTNAPGAVPKSVAPASGWWPDQDYDWSLKENSDGSRDLAIKAFAFFYHSDSTEARFYSNYVFDIQWTTSTVDITQWSTERPVYPTGAWVKADLTVDNTGMQPLDAVAEVRVYANEHDLVTQLPSIAMPSLKALGWAQVQWDTAKALGGDYALEVLLRDAAGHELDRARTELLLGGASGAITSFEVQPKTYAAGDDVSLGGTFSNTGSLSLDGEVIVLVQDKWGNTVSEFHRAFSGVAAGGTFRFDEVWSKAALGPGQCQFLVYAQFGGQTTGLSLYASEEVQPLLWEAVSVAQGKVQLTWSGQAGRTYAVDFTPDLGVIPFMCIASNLPAQSPRSIYVDDTILSKGFYRLRQDSP